MNQLSSANEWLNLYGDYLFSLAFIKVKDKENAEDLVQDTLLAAYKNRESFKGQSTERTWLTSILKNKIADYFRKNKSVTAPLDLNFYATFFEESPQNNGHWKTQALPKNWEPISDEILMTKEFNSVLSNCVSKMPSSLSSIFCAKYLDDQDSKNICKDFEISSTNYWVILHRAKLQIRQCLEKNWFNK